VLTPITLSVVAAGIVVAYLFYGRRPVPDTAPARVSAWTVAGRRDLYGDTFNERVFMLPGAILTAALVQFDNKGVDGSVNALANLVSRTSNRLRGLQTGFARSYAASMFGGAALVAAAILVVQLWR
jgi:NADH-quinone oxidoreductase subunit L